MKTTSIILARKIVPNYWEVKAVDGELPITEWKAISFSSNMSFNDIEHQFRHDATVIDVTQHFIGE